LKKVFCLGPARFRPQIFWKKNLRPKTEKFSHTPAPEIFSKFRCGVNFLDLARGLPRTNSLTKTFSNRNSKPKAFPWKNYDFFFRFCSELVPGFFLLKRNGKFFRFWSFRRKRRKRSEFVFSTFYIGRP